jgi:starvation-inducible DNA-binding protein
VSPPILDHLNQELATAWVQGFNAKRYHWTVAGPHFRDYHLRFGELYLALDAMVDELAERLRMLGGILVHAPAQMEALSAVAPSDPGANLDAAGMVREALAGEDPGTADLLTRFVQEHQKQAWFLRAMAA